MVDLLELQDGTPYDHGLAHGRAASSAIANNVETTFRRLERLGLDRRKTRQAGVRWAEYCDEKYPAYISEIKGIAAAALQPVEDLYALNFRIEIGQPLQARQLLKRTESEQSLCVPACTLFSTGDTMNSEVPRISGQTLDGLSSVLRQLIYIRRQVKVNHTTISVHEAGVAGPCIGLSSQRFSLTYAGIILDSCVSPRLTMPLRARYRACLDADNFDSAVQTAMGEPTPCAVAAMFSSSDGRNVTVEALDTGMKACHSDQIVDTHSNHPLIRTEGKSLFQYHLPDSLFRAARLKRLIQSKDISVENIKQAVSDHYSFPASICLHPDPDVESDRRAATLCAAIMDLTTGIIHVSDRQPCLQLWSSFSVGYALDA